MDDRRTGIVLAAVGNEIAMEEAAMAAARIQPGGQALGEIDGAVPPAGAADRDGEVALPFALVARQERGQHIGKAIEEAGAAGVALDELRNRAVAAGERPQ